MARDLNATYRKYMSVSRGTEIAFQDQVSPLFVYRPMHWRHFFAQLLLNGPLLNALESTPSYWT